MPPRRRAFDAVVRATEEALRRSGVEHVFVGAISVSAFGLPRTTVDIDVIANFAPGDIPSMSSAFRRRGFRTSEEDLLDALREGGHSTIEDTRSPYRVDLAAANDFAARHALEARVPVRWRAVDLPIAGPEHTIVMKLQYGSEQDLRDALSIYVQQGQRLDQRRLLAFASRQRVRGALRRLAGQAAKEQR